MVRQYCMVMLLAMPWAGLGCNGATDPPPLGVVRGRVTRIYSGEAVPGARVDVAGVIAETDAAGRFQVDHVEHGEVTVEVTATAYRDLSLTVQVGNFQSFELVLTPTDTMVTVSGVVRHRSDGPQRVRLDHGGGSAWSDGEGRWSLADIPIGPVNLVVDHPPYNYYAAEILVHTEGQEFIQTLTRDTTVTWFIEHDSYVFTRDDSLNANRGQSTVLWVTAELGRTAVFRLQPPALPYPWAELRAAHLEVAAFRALAEEDDGGPRDLVFTVVGLDTLFHENGIDNDLRPGFHYRNVETVTLSASPLDQPLSIDIGPVFENLPASFWAAGVGLATNVEQPDLGIISSEYVGLCHPSATYVLRF